MQNRKTILGVLEARKEGTPYRICEERFNVGTGTITDIVNRSKELGFSLEKLSAMEPEELVEAFYPTKVRRKYPEPDFEYIEKVIHDRGVKFNLSMGWQIHCKMCEEAGLDHYGYSQFCKLFREYLEKEHGPSHLKMMVERVPGQKTYVDWVGDQPQVLLNPETGEVFKAHIFCSTIGVSSLIFARVYPDETMPNFIDGVVGCLNAYGAIPRYIVPDNLKTAVTKHTKDELVLTGMCQDLQTFYDVVFLPPPRWKPTAKGAVENAVKHIENYLAGVLQEKGPLTLEEANQICDEVVSDLNTRHERGRKSTRQEVFDAVDRPNMRPLPEGTFTVWDYVGCTTIPKNYHLRYDGHYYSVSYRMVGKSAILRASIKDIIITDENNRLLAKHKRIHNPQPLKSTNPEHYPPDHRFAAEVNELDGDRYRSWAKEIGPSTEAVMARILATTDHEEQMYASCNGIIWHVQEQHIDPADVEAAAKFCLDNDLCVCSKFTKRITEEANRSALANQRSKKPTHVNTRGKEFYK